MKDTKQRILDKALEMFNKVGLEYVGMRELAAELDMRVGNVTYYFPTKDDLVFELVTEFSEKSGRYFAINQAFSLYEYLTRRKENFINQANYRSLHLSFVHLMQNNEKVRKQYEGVRRQRRESLQQGFEILQNGGYIKIAENEVEAFLALQAMVGRLWLAEAAVAMKSASIETQVNYFIKVFASIFRPYATKKGSKDLERFESEVN